MSFTRFAAAIPAMISSTLSTAREQRFRNAEATVKKLVGLLVKKYHVKRVVLLGSLLDKGRFGYHSDIDLCVEGIPEGRYFTAVGELLIDAADFDVDLIPFEDATPEMKERVKRGRILYEKR